MNPPIDAKVPESPPAKQLGAFLAKYDDPVAGMARKALAHLRKRLPGDPIRPACGGPLLIKALAAKQRPRRGPPKIREMP